MITNFYKIKSKEAHKYELVASKNIQCIPHKDTLIKVRGRLFKIKDMYFNVEDNSYDIYLVKAHYFLKLKNE